MSCSAVFGSALARLKAFAPDVAVIFGSGLAAGLPAGAEPIEEFSYAQLGWPCTTVPGHHSRLRLVLLTVGSSHLRVALACGRPHLYEGWSEEEVQRPVCDLVAAGVRRIALANSCGSLTPAFPAGSVVVCGEIVDLQRQPQGAEPPRLSVCDAEGTEQIALALWRSLEGVEVGSGAYVALRGPQFETPAEVAWLATYGEAVGMSAAPEVRAAHRGGASTLLLGLIANAAGAVASHEEVLTAGGDLAQTLRSALAPALLARWPELV